MAELPHMPMFWSDYFGDTNHLTTQEHGAYLLLMGEYWLKGHGLPDDDERLARRARMPKKEWLTIRETIAEFFIIIDGVWQHKRIEQELSRTRRQVEQKRSAGRASAAARSNSRSTDVAKPSQRKTNSRSTDGATSISISNKNPLTPLRCAEADAPGPSGGRASAGDVAKPIGEIVANLPRRIPA